MNTIPLHLLPDEAYILVLLSMEIYDQLAYSLCSKNTKEAIKSLNLKKGSIKICVRNSIELVIWFEGTVALKCCFAYDDSFPNNQIIARENIKVVVDSYRAPIRWESNFQNFEFKGWLHHFREVLHYPRIDELYFSGENLDDNYVEPFQTAIRGIQIRCLFIEDEPTPEFTKKALESFQNYETLILDQIPFDSHEVHEMDKYLIQNLMSVYISEAEEIRIDQVLFSNSESVSLCLSKFSEKDINRFLKLWIRGSNPRLKYLYTMGEPLLGRDSLNMNLVLRGIKSNQIPLDSEEVHIWEMGEDDYEETQLAGGYRIWSLNGTTAVIRLLSAGQFDFIVE
ncbi:unnamed protein product [Caenorhabditis brenneri]